MHYRSILLVLAAASFTVGCNSDSSLPEHISKQTLLNAPASAFYDRSTPEQRARRATAAAAAQFKLSHGFMNAFVGTARSVLTDARGATTVIVGSGNHVTISLVTNATGVPRFRIASRSTRDFEESGDDGSGATPGPNLPPLPPENFDGCSGQGGATWVDDSGAEGCSGPSAPPVILSCGTWTWSSFGHGRLVTGDGTSFSDLNWIRDHLDGSCQLW